MKRIGVVGIVITDNLVVTQVNEIISEHNEIIIGRMGIPYKEKDIAVISLIVDGSTDSIGALTGKLGNVAGVNVKSALNKPI